MAAPTSVRCEATSLSTVALFWVYGGTNAVSVYRSPAGVTYAVVSSPPVALGTLTYIDTDLAAGTRYWYKLSDDNGATFSSVVTVFTHDCVAPATGGDGFALPRFQGGEQQSDDLNNMAQRIEDTLQGRLLDPAECAVCPADGAIVIDCSDGCREFVVVADEDIKSISIQMCDEGESNIEFIIPPNVTRLIGGWPNGFGFSGDEGFRAPIVSGAAGRSVSVPFAKAGRAGAGKAGQIKSRPGYGGGVGRGGGGGGAACTCVPGKTGQLTIKSCNAGNSLKCSSTKSLDLLVCGGKGPYTWSRTGTINLQGVSGSTPGATATGTKITVTPPTNTGSGEAGTAYETAWYCCTQCPTPGPGVCLNYGVCGGTTYGCNDNVITACAVAAGSCAHSAPAIGAMKCTTHVVANPCLPACSPSTIPTCATGVTDTCDARTAPMIAAGCAPCGVSVGATVSVTDSTGVVTTVVLTA